MRVLITVLLVVVVLAPPAAAGTAEAPDIIDPCGGAERVRPENDICSAWFQADVSGDAPVLSVTVRTLEPTAEQLRVVSAAWTAGACRWQATYDDAAASPRPLHFGDGGVAFPEQHPVRLQVGCDPYTRPCDPDVGLNCTSSGYERRGVVELPADAVVVDGTDVTLTLDLGALDLSGTAVADAAFGAGETLAEIRVDVATSPQGMVVPGGGTVVSISGFGFGVPTSDSGWGDAYTLPARSGEV
jgi:hypothetical protein